MARFVVAGVTGRVGSVVAETLLARSETPTVIVREASRGGVWARRGCDVAVGSLGDAAFLTETLRGAGGFFTLLPENVAPDDFHGARRRMADAIGAAVAASQVPHVVMLSNIGAFVPEGTGPVKDLYYLEERLRASGTRLSALRACYFQDNIASVMQPAIGAGIYPTFMPAAAAFSMIATRDVGRFAANVLVEPPSAHETVDLLGPVYSGCHVAERLGAALRRSLRIIEIPPAGHIDALMQAGAPRSFAEAVAEMFAAFAAGMITPKGDRRLVGTTTIDEVIAGCVPRHEQAELPT